MRRFFVTYALAGLVFMFGSFTVCADGANDSIEEVTVTATRRAESIMEVDLSIQAISEEQMARPTFKDVNDLFNLVPGATAHGHKQPATEVVQLRGSGLIQTNAGDGASPVGYYVDDIPFVDVFGSVPPPIGTFDLQRAEILRGPQGTSYGQDSVGGSIILRTNPVDLDSFGYKVRAGFSERDGNNGSNFGAVVNIPVSDTFGVRLSAQQETDPSYGRVEGRPDIDDANEYDRTTLRVKAFWQATDTIEVEATYNSWETDYNYMPGYQILDSTTGELVNWESSIPMLLSLFPDGRIEQDFEVEWTTLRVTADLGWAELTSSTGLVDIPKKENNNEVTFDIGYGPMFTAVISNEPSQTLTQEFRFVSKGEGPLQWIAGLYYQKGESDAKFFASTPSFQYDQSGDDQRENERTSLFGEIEYALSNNLSVMAGLRTNDEERETYSKSATSGYYFGLDPLFGPYSFEDPDSSTEEKFDNISYRMGITWDLSDDAMIYLTHSSVARAPTYMDPADMRALSDAGIPQMGDQDVNETKNTELGGKWSLLDGSLDVEAVYVHVEYIDVPLWVNVNIQPTPVSTAIADTEFEADILELVLNWRLSDNLSVSYAGAFTETELLKLPASGSLPPMLQVGGDLFNYHPETHNLGLDYSNEFDGGMEWTISMNYVHRTKPNGIESIFSSQSYTPALDAYEYMTVSLGLSKGPWSFDLAVENATDFNGMYQPASANNDPLWRAILPPRTVSLQVSYDML
tara:strand:- start:285 stop:2519 length:2235 start_codon:yes stop_codon:yes gene_type:complete